jgi:putative (di)nucleoside polyphosphate hydrolase
MQDNEYRLNVGVIVANKQGKLLLCKRKGINSWQFPQGGIDIGENSLKAAKRELFEEVGISSKSVRLIDSIEFDCFKWVSYWYPLNVIISFKEKVYREALNKLKYSFCKEFNNV